ncbi:MAG: nitroreductase family protein [Clostridia bacterium]|nr:nitroreductase family protein [Clostridia bacterium]
MEFDELLRRRCSTRRFKSEQLSGEQIEKLIEAANRAPVGSNLYRDVHITVVQDQKKLLTMCEASWKRFSGYQKIEDIAGDVADVSPTTESRNFFYGAPTVFFVSHRKQDLQPGIEWANVTAIVSHMQLEAVNLGLGSVYIWGALESMRMFPELDHTDLLELPEDFVPLLGLAVGYPEQALTEREIKHNRITVNCVK